MYNEFSVVDTEGEVVQSGLVSDANGIVRVTDLALGEYSFEEMKARVGYVLNTKVLNFTIVAEEEEEPTLIETGNLVNHQGSVTLIKQNFEDVSEKLDGTEFALTDKDG